MSHFAIGIQIARVGTDGAQALIIPKVGQVWTRSVSTAHPRGRWERSVNAFFSRFSHSGDWGAEDTRRLLALSAVSAYGNFTDRLPNEKNVANQYQSKPTDIWKWNLVTGKFPLLVGVTDEELEELESETLPRNIALRFQRGLEENGVMLFGKKAVTLDEACAQPLGMTRPLPEDLSLFEWFSGVLTTSIHDILTRSPENLEAEYADYYPKSARCADSSLNVKRSRTKHATRATNPSETDDAGTTCVRPGTTLTRPNGQPYIVRSVDADIELSDIDLFRRAHKRGAHILAFGEPGTGKTAGFEVAFPGLITMIGTAETEADHFVGSYVVTLGEDGKEALTWEDGPLIRAMENGVPLFIDEIGVIAPNQLTVLFSVMDGRGELCVTANPARGVVKAKEGFGVIAATNPNAAGVRLSEALLSRFGVKIEIGTNYKAARTLGVNRRIVDAAEHLAKQCQTGEASWAPQMRELLQFRDDEADIGLIFALRNLLNNVPEMEREVVQAHLQERFGDTVAANRLTGLQVS